MYCICTFYNVHNETHYHVSNVLNTCIFNLHFVLITYTKYVAKFIFVLFLDSVMSNVKSNPQLEEKSKNKDRREMEIYEELEYERLLRRRDKWGSRYEHMPKLMRMGLAKMAGGHFGCDMTVFPLDTSYTVS